MMRPQSKFSLIAISIALLASAIQFQLTIDSSFSMSICDSISLSASSSNPYSIVSVNAQPPAEPFAASHHDSQDPDAMQVDRGRSCSPTRRARDRSASLTRRRSRGRSDSPPTAALASISLSSDAPRPLFVRFRLRDRSRSRSRSRSPSGRLHLHLRSTAHVFESDDANPSPEAIAQLKELNDYVSKILNMQVEDQSSTAAIRFRQNQIQEMMYQRSAAPFDAHFPEPIEQSYTTIIVNYEKYQECLKEHAQDLKHAKELYEEAMQEIKKHHVTLPPRIARLMAQEQAQVDVIAQAKSHGAVSDLQLTDQTLMYQQMCQIILPFVSHNMRDEIEYYAPAALSRLHPLYEHQTIKDSYDQFMEHNVHKMIGIQHQFNRASKALHELMEEMDKYHLLHGAEEPFAAHNRERSLWEDISQFRHAVNVEKVRPTYRDIVDIVEVMVELIARLHLQVQTAKEHHATHPMPMPMHRMHI